MRLITWNMGCAYGHTYKTSQPRTWRQLLAWQPDVALVQETTDPSAWLAPDTYVFTPYGWSANRTTPVGTLVYAAAGKLAPVDLELEAVLPGQVTAATLTRPGSPDGILVASVHAATSALDPSTLPSGLDPAVGSSHTSKIYPVDLIRHELTDLSERRRFVIGGDLNLSVRFDDLYTAGSDLYGNVEWFSKVRSRGWRNAHRKFHAGDQRTLFRPGKPHEDFQLDHVFTDKRTWDDLQSCDVLAVPYLEELTDHAPMALALSS